jgi:hypothetical protein
MTPLRRFLRPGRRKAELGEWRLPPRRPDETDWEQVARRGGFVRYNALRRALVFNSIGSDAGAVLQAAVPGRELSGLIAALETPRRPAAVLELYGELMRAPADAEVLRGYLGWRIRQALRNAAPGNLAPPLSWAVSTCCYAAVVAYKASGQRRFLRLVARTFESILPLRDCERGLVDECRGRVGKGWGGSQFARGRYTTNVTTAGRIVYPVALFCAVVRADGALQQQYGAQAETFLPVLEEVLTDLDDAFVTAGEAGYYRRPCSQRPEPMNHMAWAGCAFLTLHDLTGTTQYLERAERLARYLKAAMYDDGAGHPVWDYDPSPQDHRGSSPERLWKAQVTTQFITCAAEKGVVFAPDDLGAVCATLQENVFLARGRINTRIDRVAEPLDGYTGRTHAGMGSLIAFLELEDHCPGLKDRIVDVVANRPGAGGWFTTAPGAIGYARRLR